jgi:GWxTD domain-containing protein
MFSGVFAQEAGSRKTSLPFEIDYAKFRMGGGFVQLEVYYSVFRQRLTFLPSEDRYEARFAVEVWLTQNDSVVARDKWALRTVAGSLDEVTSSQKLFTLTRFNLPPGSYRLQTRVTDLNSGLFGEKAGTIRITPIPTDRLCLSDIELSARISRDTLDALYLKNGLTVVPNPSGVYGLPMPLLYYYSEIYNLHPSDREYQVNYAILDKDKNVIKELPGKSKRKAAANLVEVGGINVVSLANGRYFIRLTVTDPETGESAVAEKRFFVYKEAEPPPTEVAEAATEMDWREEYDRYTARQIDQEFDAARYIATKEEVEAFEKLDTEQRREFLINFWARRDANQQTLRNEYREDYLARLRYAESNFSGFGPGWRSDRGRVLLVYGRPDEIERYPSSGGVKAYEIWRYFTIQGGVDFVFVDRKGWGDLQLVHSTARGEINDPDWTRWISTN